MHSFYPITIIASRYGGVYEGGAWSAFPCYPESVPYEASGDDVECCGWWADNGGQAAAAGETPNDALLALEEALASLAHSEGVPATLGRLRLLYGRFQVLSEEALIAVRDRQNGEP